MSVRKLRLRSRLLSPASDSLLSPLVQHKSPVRLYKVEEEEQVSHYGFLHTIANEKMNPRQIPFALPGFGFPLVYYNFPVHYQVYIRAPFQKLQFPGRFDIRGKVLEQNIQI